MTGEGIVMTRTSAHFNCRLNHTQNDFTWHDLIILIILGEEYNLW
jgi:hypothetical protein